MNPENAMIGTEQRVTKQGYVLARDTEGIFGRKDAEVLEHRLIMAYMYGPKALRGKIVRHLNGDTLDNRVENLAIFPKSRYPATKGKPDISYTRSLALTRKIRRMRLDGDYGSPL
jgi:hypothetical protein